MKNRRTNFRRARHAGTARHVLVTGGDLAKLVIEVLGSRSPIEFVPYDQAYAPGFDDMRRRRPNVDKLESVTGFRPTTLLRRIVESTTAAT